MAKAAVASIERVTDSSSREQLVHRDHKKRDPAAAAGADGVRGVAEVRVAAVGAPEISRIGARAGGVQEQ
ncbi:unnamed protein product [Heligmosomoides polygyrus]|uniref:Uncharacterized protein n=1 Tax=Heligmosomoides polygyrus TaxID=6339 RepID=A0A183GJI6_HELPZ|nr:unnamed protein product [Heligmosomoides polygyrus]